MVYIRKYYVDRLCTDCFDFLLHILSVMPFCVPSILFVDLSEMKITENVS